MTTLSQLIDNAYTTVENNSNIMTIGEWKGLTVCIYYKKNTKDTDKKNPKKITKIYVGNSDYEVYCKKPVAKAYKSIRIVGHCTEEILDFMNNIEGLAPKTQEEVDTLADKLTLETQDLKDNYIKKIEEWAVREWNSIQEFRKSYTTGNYSIENEIKYYNLPAISCGHTYTVQDYVAYQKEKAQDHYNNSILKLATRVLKKGLNVKNLELSTTYFDPNISTIITDGNKSVRAWTIIASGEIQKPHYRYLVK